MRMWGQFSLCHTCTPDLLGKSHLHLPDTFPSGIGLKAHAGQVCDSVAKCLR